jgi:hypothetical protein
MGWRPWLAVGAAGALVLLAALVLQSPSRPAREAAGREDPRPPDERPGAPVASGRPPPGSVDSPNEVERDDNRTKPIPGTERWHYERFLRLAAAEPERFDRLAGEKARSEAPLQERVALLRAAWETRGKKALPWFSDAFSRTGSPDALRGFVVRHLASQARAVSEVRDFLRDKVFLAETVDARDRGVAGRAVLQAAPPGEISTLRAAILGITDPTVAEGALVGLGLNHHADAADALTWLSRHHPLKGVRERAAEISRQRRTGDVGEEEED